MFCLFIRYYSTAKILPKSFRGVKTFHRRLQRLILDLHLLNEAPTLSFRWISRFVQEVIKDFGGTPRIFRGMSQNFRGMSRNFRGMSRKFRGMSRNFRGMSQKFRGMSQNFGGMSRNSRGMSQRIRGMSQNSWGMSQNLRGPPKNRQAGIPSFGVPGESKCLYP
jgi:hypothetical protein